MLLIIGRAYLSGIRRGRDYQLTSCQRRATIVTRKPHVGIIGAGLAGLRCADVLLQHGFQVTLIEGRNRLGGRVHQASLPSGHAVDVGPNWIHGTSENPIMDIAKQTDTVIGELDSMSNVIDGYGKLLPRPDAVAHATLMWEIIESAFRYSNKHSATISPEESLWDFFQKEVVKSIPESDPDFREKRKTTLQVAEAWGAFVGNHIFTQSLKYFWLEECIEGGES
jgi:monoamine oxidase